MSKEGKSNRVSVGKFKMQKRTQLSSRTKRRIEEKKLKKK